MLVWKCVNDPFKQKTLLKQMINCIEHTFLFPVIWQHFKELTAYKRSSNDSSNDYHLLKHPVRDVIGSVVVFFFLYDKNKQLLM